MSSDREASSFHTKRFGPMHNSNRKSSKVHDDSEILVNSAFQAADDDLIYGSITQTGIRPSQYKYDDMPMPAGSLKASRNGP